MTQEWEVARKQLADKLVGDFSGKKLKNITLEEWGIELIFEDETRLSVGLDGGDFYDAYLTIQGETLMHG